MNLEQKLLIRAVKASVTGQTASLEVSPNWQNFLKLARVHKLEALVFDGLRKSQIALPEDVQQDLRRAYMQAIFQDTQMEHLKGQLQETLEAAGIRHIFLKGSVLKYDYPIPALRTMCDMDILVYAEDFAKIDKIAQTLGGKAMPGDGNHRIYAFGGVLVEFHPNLLHHATPVGTGINPGWQYAKEDATGRSATELTEEGFYLNTLCHLANHFVAGGVGVRFVLDVWVSLHLRKQPMDRAYVETELAKFNLLDFARNVEQLADAWFGEQPMTPLLEELGEYILTSGSHGSSERAALNAITFSQGGTRASALMRKAFYPRAELEDRFVWCKGKPWLLPAAWCTRAFLAVKNHGHLILRWGKQTGDVTQEAVNNQRKKLERFGIKTSRM